MMKISAIAAMAKNRVIGKDNDIPWNMPKDMKFFMRTTTGHHIIMGRKNYNSLGRPLPKRTNIVITRNPFFISSGTVVFHSLEEALSFSKSEGEEEIFIIGGGVIYELALPYLDKIYLTEIDIEVDGDVFFPEFDRSEWTLSESIFHEADEKNPANMTFQTWERI